MNFEEFEKAKAADLKRMAKERFEESQSESLLGEQKVSLLLEAQFYVSELDRRISGRIAIRDLVLEIIVIVMIGLEILLAIKQGKDEDRSMDKQNAILGSLQQSTSATASTMQGLLTLTGTMNTSTASTAKTLGALEETTKTMNRGVHDQIALFYDPSVAVTYDANQNRMLFVNSGRSSLTITRLRMDGREINIGGVKRVAAGTSWYFEMDKEYEQLSSQLPKTSMKTDPIEAQLLNEMGQSYTMNAGLIYIWENDKLTVHPQTYSIVADHSVVQKPAAVHLQSSALRSSTR